METKKTIDTYSNFKRKGISYIKSKEQLKQERDIQKIARIAKNALKESPPIPKKRGRKKKIEISPEQRNILYEISKLAEEALKEFPHSQTRIETRGRKKKLSNIDRVKLKRLYRKLMNDIKRSSKNYCLKKPPHEITKELIANRLGVKSETIRRLVYTHK